VPDSIGLGFGDPVVDSQEVFRLVLDAIAHPGRVISVAKRAPAKNVSGLSDAATALALTLLDHETPVWLDVALPGAGDFLRFHCGAPLVGTPNACRFAFASDLGMLPKLTDFDLGAADFPERSTTLVLEVPELVEAPGMTLRGPGIRALAHLRVGGLTAAFWNTRAELAPLFPLGVDLILTRGRSLAAIPRTTRVEV
jgi:alpha-D-ribose 1-methylphosphonate 5-triphosphate synthase subunit PhnH